MPRGRGWGIVRAVNSPHALLLENIHTTAHEALAAVDVAFVPALAVSRQGVRLGQGGGYYDSTLPRASAAACANAPTRLRSYS